MIVNLPVVAGKYLIPGDHLIADVYEAIRQYDDLWANTLLLIICDEGGGYYDSVVSTQEMPSLAKLHPSGGWDESSVEYNFKYPDVRVLALLISAYLEQPDSCKVPGHQPWKLRYSRGQIIDRYAAVVGIAGEDMIAHPNYLFELIPMWGHEAFRIRADVIY